jgi:glycosyltransferase involved in cell wall biosynthesis
LNFFGFEYARRRMTAQSVADSTLAYLWAGRQICEQVLAEGLEGATGVYTFNSAGLELLKAARQQGLCAIMEQTIAPYELECQLLEREHGDYPDWEPSPQANGRAAEFIAREKAEWEQADLILCGSEFVKDGIGRCRGPVGKCAVVPYGVDASFELPERGPRRPGPLRVLTVGAVGLRKGSPYVLGAARALRGRVEFRMVGSVGVQPEAVAQMEQAGVELRGPVPRSEVINQYEWADVFLLPSICEGSATATYEAVACGLPVIVTPNTGSVVKHGVEGFIVPVRDVGAIVEKLDLLDKNAALRLRMSRQARALARANTLQAYSERLIGAIEGKIKADTL